MTQLTERFAAKWWADELAKVGDKPDLQALSEKLANALMYNQSGDPRQTPFVGTILTEWALERGREARRLHLAKHRATVTPETIRLTAADVVSVIEEAPTPRESWLWTKPDGATIDLLHLNRREAVDVIRQCERAGVNNFKLAGILKLAASRLTGDERIGDRVTVAELEHFEAHIEVAYPLPDLRSVPPWNPDSPPSQASSTTPATLPATVSAPSSVTGS